MSKVQVLTFAFLIFLAAFLRFYKLDQVPAGFDWDEAALGYNAYSILKTGADEYGVKFPLTLRSFEDYKPPLYTYLTIPSVAIFGLNEFAVRFPSALLGTLTVVIVYFLLKESFPGSQLKIKNWKFDIPTIAMLLLVISPWHLQFSRMAFEANVGLFFVVLGVWLFLKGLVKGQWLILAAISFALSLYAYHTLRIFTPLLLLGLVFYYRKNLWQIKKYTLTSFILGLLLILPVVNILLSKEGRVRFQGVSIFADPAFLEPSIKKIEEDQKDKIPLAQILHNRRLEYLWFFTKGYLAHFDLNFLFTSGGTSPMHHPPNMGQLYLWELPFVILGIIFLIRQKGPARFLIFWWFLIAPLASAPTRDAPNAVRTLIFLPTFQIFTALGVREFLNFKRILLAPLLLVVAANFLYYLHLYYTHLPRDLSSYWQYGYRQAVGEVLKRKNDYQKVVISTKLDQPHIFFLFYTKYDPATYQKEGGTKLAWIRTGEYQFGKYQFAEINWEKVEKQGVLFVGMPNDFPPGAPVLETVKFLNGREAIKIVGVQ